MYTEADIQTRQFEAAASDIANGVCPLCDEALDPTHPRWAGEFADPEREARIVGPHSTTVPGYHDECVAVS